MFNKKKRKIIKLDASKVVKNIVPEKTQEPIEKCFFMVFEWMANDLHLSGNDLIVFAIINQFTHKTITEWYTGGYKVLKAMTNTTTKQIHTILQNLVKKKYIVAKMMGKYVNYKVNDAYLSTIIKTKRED